MEADPRLSRDIARAAGFSPASLSHWTRGKRVPGADELAALAGVFGVPLDAFFDQPSRTPPRPAHPARQLAEAGWVADALAEAEALLERAQSLKAVLQKLESGSSSGRSVEQAGNAAVRIAREYANELKLRRSRSDRRSKSSRAPATVHPGIVPGPPRSPAT